MELYHIKHERSFFPALHRSSSSWLMGKTAQFTNEAYPSLAHNFLTVTILKVTLIDGIEILWESRRTASERWILWRTNAAAAVDFGRSFMRITSLIGNETRKWRLECKWRRTPPRGHFMVLLHFVLGTRRNPIRFFINSFNWEANAKTSLPEMKVIGSGVFGSAAIKSLKFGNVEKLRNWTAPLDDVIICWFIFFFSFHSYDERCSLV